jgi:hypothetical protein
MVMRELVVACINMTFNCSCVSRKSTADEKVESLSLVKKWKVGR